MKKILIAFTLLSCFTLTGSLTAQPHSHPHPATTSTVSGIYWATLPSASGSGREIALILHSDHTYLFVEHHIDRGSLITQGLWEQKNKNLTLQPNDKKEPTHTFRIETTSLISNSQEYGSMGLQLKKATSCSWTGEKH